MKNNYSKSKINTKNSNNNKINLFLYSIRKKLILLLAVLIIIFLASFYYSMHPNKPVSIKNSFAEMANNNVSPLKINNAQNQDKIKIHTDKIKELTDKTQAPKNVMKVSATEIKIPTNHIKIHNDKIKTPTNKLKPNTEQIKIHPEKVNTTKALHKSPLVYTFYQKLKNDTVQTNVNRNQIIKYKYTYMLQIGSYKSKIRAQSINSKLILKGINSEILKKGDWYIVIIPDIQSHRDGDKIRYDLEKSGLQGSLLIQTNRKKIIAKPETKK